MEEESIIHSHPLKFKKRKWNTAKFLNKQTATMFHDVLIHNGYSVAEFIEVKVRGGNEGRVVLNGFALIHNLKPEPFCDGV